MIAELVPYTDDGMGLEEAIAAYLSACDVEGKSPRTVDDHRSVGQTNGNPRLSWQINRLRIR